MSNIIELLLAQLETTAVIIAGHSIIESWLVCLRGACRGINAGLGGT